MADASTTRAAGGNRVTGVAASRLVAPLLVGAAAALAWRERLRRAPTEPIWDGWRYQVAAEALARGEVLTWNHVGFSALAVPLLPFYGERAAWALSMAAGVAAVVLAFGLVRRAVGPAAGVAASFLVAFTPVHVYWSGTGHAGTLALAFALAATWALYAGRGVLVLALVVSGVSVRPDFVLLVPFLVTLPRADPSVLRRATRPLLLALPLLAVLAAFYLSLHGARPGRVSWDVPPEVAPADWDARALRKADGTLGLGPAGPAWSPGYAAANLVFYADVLLDWSLRDWSGWVLHVPSNPFVTAFAVTGVALAPRRWVSPCLFVALPVLGVYAVYYGFSPEYVFLLLVPFLLAGGEAVERAVSILRSSKGTSDDRGPSAARPSALVPEHPFTPNASVARGHPHVFDRIRNAIGSKRETPGEAGPARTRTVVTVVVHDAPASYWDLGNVIPEEGVKGPVEGGGPAMDETLLRRIVTGRQSGDGRTVFDVLAENGVRFAAVNPPIRLPAELRRGPGLAASFEEQARSAEAAAGETGWRMLAVFLRAVRPADSWEREWARLNDAVARIREAAGPGALQVFLFLDAPTGRGDLAILGSDVPHSPAPLSSVGWVDVAPTVYRALRVNVPDDLDGLPIEEAFRSGELSEEDERRVQEHLEKLGYL